MCYCSGSQFVCLVLISLVMRSVFVCLLCFLSSVFTLHAQEELGMLWRISNESIEYDSYVFGTIHVKDKRVFNFNDSVLVLLDQSEGFAMEVRMDELMSGDLMKAMTYPEGKSLKTELSQENYARVANTVMRMKGLKLDDYVQYRPLPLLSLVSAPDVDQGEQAPYIVDEYLFERAKNAGKELFSIEKVETQLELFRSFGEEELMITIDELEANEDANNELLEEMIVAYSEGRLESLSTILKEQESEEMEAFYQQLFGDRNKDMAIRITEIIQNKSVFVAIGAGHLLGKGGVLALLEKEGYLVKPIQATRSGAVDFHDEESMIEEPFLIDFPEEPIKNIQHLNTEVGTMDIVTYVLEGASFGSVDNKLYTLGYVKYPEGISETIKTQENFNDMYDAAVAQSAAAVGGKVVSQENSVLLGFPARKSIVSIGDDKKMEMEVWYVLVNNCMYFLQVGYDQLEVNSDEKNRFFNSFDLKKTTTEELEEAFDQRVEQESVKMGYLQAGYFSTQKNADFRVDQLKELGVSSSVIKDGAVGFRVIISEGSILSLQHFLDEKAQIGLDWPGDDVPIIKVN